MCACRWGGLTEVLRQHPVAGQALKLVLDDVATARRVLDSEGSVVLDPMVVRERVDRKAVTMKFNYAFRSLGPPADSSFLRLLIQYASRSLRSSARQNSRMLTVTAKASS